MRNNEVEAAPSATRKESIIVDNSSLPVIKDKIINKEEKSTKKHIKTQIEDKTVKKENPQRLFGKFQFQFFMDILKPDCLFQKDEKKSYVYFNLEKLYNILNRMFNHLFKKYPNTLEEIKESIEAYIKDKKKHDKEFIENKNGVKDFFRTIKFWFIKEKYNREAKNEVIKLAYCMAQLKDLKENDPENFKKCIGFIDTEDYKITPYNFQVFDFIRNQFEYLKITGENISEINENIKVLNETFDDIRKQIKNEYEENDIPVLMSFLIKNIDDKLSKIEDLNIPEETDTYKNMTDLIKKLNKFIFKYMFIKKEINNFFFGITFELKIIKNLEKEKIVILNQGKNLNDFYSKLKTNFENLRDHLNIFDEDDDEKEPVTEKDKMEFIRNYMAKLKKLEDLNGNIEKKIYENYNKTFNNGIQTVGDVFSKMPDKKVKEKIKTEGEGEGKIEGEVEKVGNSKLNINIIKDVGNSAFQINENFIDLKLLKKTRKNLENRKNETIKLIKEYELITKIEKKMEEIKEKNVCGLSITRKINDEKNQLEDLYIVDIIY